MWLDVLVTCETSSTLYELIVVLMQRNMWCVYISLPISYANATYKSLDRNALEWKANNDDESRYAAIGGPTNKSNILDWYALFLSTLKAHQSYHKAHPWLRSGCQLVEATTTTSALLA